MWDAMFLWFMLDHASDRNYSRMYYNHQDDPDIRRWRQETEKLSGENAELKAKLASLDKQVAGLKGQPVDPTYIPPGVDADIVLNKKVIETAHPVKKESHFLRWLLIFALIALVVYYIYHKMKGSGTSAKYRLD
jgi:cell division protein FtsB